MSKTVVSTVNREKQVQKCYDCNLWLNFNNFWKDKRSASGLCRQCKHCFKKTRQTVEYKKYRKNYEKTEKYKQYHLDYEKNRRIRTEKDKESRRKRDKRYLKNPLYKLKQSCSKRIRECINKRKKTVEFLGCSIEYLKIFLENQFKDGMNWNNHGLHGWHIDHKIPLSSAKTEEEIYKLFHYTNLQPLWAKDNLKKSNKIL